MWNPKTSRALTEARKLVAQLEAYDDTPGSRIAALKQTDRVRTALQEPIDVTRHMVEQLSLAGALHTILGIGAYHDTPDKNQGASITAKQLAAQTNVADTVVQRVYRVAISHGVFTETAPDTYRHNDLSRTLLDPQALGAVHTINMEFARSWCHLPEYLKSHAPNDILDLNKSVAAHAHGQGHLGKSYYALIEDDPDPARRESWDAGLKTYDELMPIDGIFPFASLKEEVEKDPERPFLVDVGSGRGQSCFTIQREIGDAFEAKFILQDLPGVISLLKPEDYPGMELMVHDAFTPQPIKNARIYFLRRLLHDFYPPDCIKIVKNTVSAMGPDSRLLICDMLVPDIVDVYENLDLYWLDLGLLCVGGHEKTMIQMNEILDAAGLEAVKVHPSPFGKTMMLEARLKGGYQQ